MKVAQPTSAGLSTSTDALLEIAGRVGVSLALADAEGRECTAVVESVQVETAGPLRATHCVRGTLQTPDGERVCEFRLRGSAYAGLPLVRLEPLILVNPEQGIVQRIRSLRLCLTPRRPAASFRLGGEPGYEGPAASPVRLFQRDDERYTLEIWEHGERGIAALPTLPICGEGLRAPGWAEWRDAAGSVAAAVRDFRQQWPKSLEASPDGLAVGLFPAFREGDFAHMEPWYKHQYLFEGECYRLRVGQARRWEVWLALDGDGASLSRAADAPLVPAADPAQAIATGVWDAIAPAGSPEMAYDLWAENLFHAYTHAIEVQRDYGAMNWGDWFGERKVNWGNHEYDTTNQLLVQFARTGDPRYFLTADAAGRHSAEVDTVHFVNEDLAAYFNDNWRHPGYPPRPGMVHEHAVGHVGGFYPVERIRQLFLDVRAAEAVNPYLCLDPFNLGHIFTQGMARLYFLTGDPFVRETIERIGDNLAQLVEDREFRFMGSTHCGRVTGWTLLALAGAYEVGLSERYLGAMRTLAEDALADQDPVCGGWLIHPMAPDHCLCKTARHTGMAGFITAVLINGLSRYYLLSGDERLPDAIARAVTFLDNDTWREEWRDWRYTSCPATKATGQPGVVMMAHVNGVRIAGVAEHLRILRIAWERKFERLLQAPPPGPGFGKSYTSIMYGCAETAGLLAGRECAG